MLQLPRCPRTCKRRAWGHSACAHVPSSPSRNLAFKGILFLWGSILVPEHKLLHDLSLPSFTDPTSCHSTPPLIYLNETELLTDRYMQLAISYCQAFAHTVSSSQMSSLWLWGQYLLILQDSFQVSPPPENPPNSWLVKHHPLSPLRPGT